MKILIFLKEKLQMPRINLFIYLCIHLLWEVSKQHKEESEKKKI